MHDDNDIITISRRYFNITNSRSYSNLCINMYLFILWSAPKMSYDKHCGQSANRRPSVSLYVDNNNDYNNKLKYPWSCNVVIKHFMQFRPFLMQNS